MAGTKTFTRVQTTTVDNALVLMDAGTVNIGGGASSVLTGTSGNPVVVISAAAGQTTDLNLFGLGLGVSSTGSGTGVSILGAGTKTIDVQATALDGLDVSTASGVGFNAVGGIVGVTGSGSDLVSSTGTVVNLQAGTVVARGITFASVTSGAANGILITQVSQVASSSGIDILGGSINRSDDTWCRHRSDLGGHFDRGDDHHAAAGRSVEVTSCGRAGGSVIEFSGFVTDVGLGIHLDNNDQASGATIGFTGGLSLTTGGKYCVQRDQRRHRLRDRSSSGQQHHHHDDRHWH